MASPSNTILLEGLLNFEFTKFPTDYHYDEPRSEDDGFESAGLLSQCSIGPTFVFGEDEQASFDFVFHNISNIFSALALGVLDPFTSTLLLRTPIPLHLPENQSPLQSPSTPIEHTPPDVSSDFPQTLPEPASENISATATPPASLSLFTTPSSGIFESITNTIPLPVVSHTHTSRPIKRASGSDAENDDSLAHPPKRRRKLKTTSAASSSIRTGAAHIRFVLVDNVDFYSTNITEDGMTLSKLAAYVCKRCDHRFKSKGDIKKHIAKYYPPTHHCKQFGCPCSKVVGGEWFRRESAMQRHIKSAIATFFRSSLTTA